jgi:hypothetical protein
MLWRKIDFYTMDGCFFIGLTLTLTSITCWTGWDNVLTGLVSAVHAVCYWGLCQTTVHLIVAQAVKPAEPRFISAFLAALGQG